MYNFEQELLNDEKILYQGRPVSGKGKKNTLILIIFICVLLLVQCIMFWKVKSVGFGINEIIIFIVTALFTILFTYALIYELFLKKKAVSDDYYCLTNKRVLKFEEKSKKLVSGYLLNYQTIEAFNVKKNYGSVRFAILYNNGNENLTIEDLTKIKELAFNPDLKNMPEILFESVENPELIVTLAIKARHELQKK